MCNARPVQRKSKTSAFISDFRDLTVGDFVVHVEHGIAKYMGLRTHRPGWRTAGVDDPGICRAGKAVCAVDAARPDPEVPQQRGRARARTEPHGRRRVGQDQGTRQEGNAGHDRRAAEAVCAAAGGNGLRLHARFADHARVRRCLRLQRDGRPACRHRRHQARHGIDAAHGSPAVRRRGLWQDRSCHARGAEGRAGFQAGGRADADDRAQLPAFSIVQKTVRALSGQCRNDLQLPHGKGAEKNPGRHGRGQGRYPHRHASPAVEGLDLPGSRPAGGR